MQNVIQETLKSNTKWMDYDPKTASIISKELSELVKEKVITPTPSLTRSLPHPLTRSLTHSLTRSLARSLR